MPEIDGGIDRGPQPLPVDLTITEQGVSEQVRVLGETGTRLAEDGLSVMEQQFLETSAQAMLADPNLPEPDRAALQSWLQKVSDAPITQNIPVATDLSPEVARELASTNADVIENALFTLFGSKLTPEQKEALKNGGVFRQLAIVIAQRNSEPGTAKPLQSFVPQDIAKELNALLKQLTISEDPKLKDAFVALEKSVEDVAKDISVVNIMDAFMPEETLKDALKSKDTKVVYDALLENIDTSAMTTEEKTGVETAMKELAAKIADANEKGTPIAGLDSDDPETVKAALIALLGGEGFDETSVAGKAVVTALGQLAHSIAAAGGSGGPPPPGGEILLTAPRGFNAYMTPGIMAYLAPILSELAEIYADIIKQSSDLKQNMMGLMVAMALDAFAFAIAAGEAKVELLELEVQQAIMGVALAVSSVVMAAAMTAGIAKIGSRAQSKWVEQHRAPEKGGVGVPNYNDPIMTKTKGPDGEYLQARNPDGTMKFGMRDATPEDYMQSREFSTMSQKQQGYHTMSSAINQAWSQGGQNLATAIFKSQMIDPTMEQAEAEAMNQFLNQLIQIVVDTMKTAAEEISRADKDWQSFNQLFRDFASTIRQAIYSQA